MDLDRQPLVQVDSAAEKPSNSTEAASSLQETPEQKKKLKTVGFYELEVLQTPECDEVTEDAKSVNSVKDDDDGFSSKDDNLDGAQPQEGEEKNPSYLDQVSPCSPQRCQKQSRPTCLCKECVENYMNLCEEFQEPPGIDELKKKEVQEPPDVDEQKNEEVQEPPDMEEQKNDVFLPYEDSTSISSNRSESRSSERSRRTISSGEEFVGQRYEDAQVTLPYPERSQPPECITRLSNAGLYERNEDVAEKGGKEEDDKISQVVSAAFFVKHPDEQFPQKKRVQLEMVDIERGEPECEPLLRTIRRPAEEEEDPHPMLCHCSRGCLKIVGSFVASLIVFPAFLYGAYAWLPFDAPFMPDIPTRLVYTMRCAAFATFPLVLGVIIHGISRLCAASYDPFKPREREVTIHRRFVKQGTFLFVLFFFNLSVLATYLHQDYLKMVPLLTCLFALAQLIYWLSFAVTRSFRGFGYGLTFLPLVFMMISNLYYMFVVEPEKMIFIGSKNVPSN